MPPIRAEHISASAAPPAIAAIFNLVVVIIFPLASFSLAYEAHHDNIAAQSRDAAKIPQAHAPVLSFATFTLNCSIIVKES